VNERARLDDDVTIFDMNRKCFGDEGALLQFLAARDRDRIGTDLESFRIEPGLAVAHVELPAVPGTAQHFADARTLIDAGLRRGQPRHAGRLVQRRALMRAAVQECEELAIDMEHDDVAALDTDDLVAAGRNVRGTRDDVTGHQGWFRSNAARGGRETEV
jgi:hypothetical protein